MIVYLNREICVVLLPSILSRFGNGGAAPGPGSSDQDSIAARKQNAAAVQQSGLQFDIVEIANWTPHPSRNLPQSDPNTLASFLHWYQCSSPVAGFMDGGYATSASEHV
jgi:hypothetical protein